MINTEALQKMQDDLGTMINDLYVDNAGDPGNGMLAHQLVQAWDMIGTELALRHNNITLAP